MFRGLEARYDVFGGTIAAAALAGALSASTEATRGAPLDSTRPFSPAFIA